MDLTTLTATGAIGWIILVATVTIRGCVAGHAPSALLSGFILAILLVNVWAIAPREFSLEQNLFRYALGWMLAIAPYVFVAGRVLVNRGRSKAL